MATTSGYREAANERDAADGDENSIVGLLKSLRDETGNLLKQEVALAKTEAGEKAARFARNGGYLAAGAGIVILGAIFLLMALSNLIAVGLVDAGLSEEVASWLAPTIVGAAIAGAGFALVMKAMSTFRTESVIPEKTVESLKENKEWLQRKIS